MTRTRLWVVALGASGMLAAAGVVHGVWTDRWRAPADVQAAAAQLQRLPQDIGPWRGSDVPQGRPVPGVAGCLERRYERRPDGARVSVALVCGRPGPVSIHTPDACYGASGFQVGARRKVEVPGLGSFWRTDAVRTSATDEVRLRIYYGWHTAGGWTAADDARTSFARERLLHKLYVVRELTGADGREEPCEEFLRVILPELSRTVFAAEGTLASVP
jgi:hypothetical protein